MPTSTNDHNSRFNEGHAVYSTDEESDSETANQGHPESSMILDRMVQLISGQQDYRTEPCQGGCGRRRALPPQRHMTWSNRRNRTNFEANSLDNRIVHIVSRDTEVLPRRQTRSNSSWQSGRRERSGPYQLPICSICRQTIQILYDYGISGANTSCGHVLGTPCANILINISRTNSISVRCPVCRHLLEDPAHNGHPAIFRFHI